MNRVSSLFHATLLASVVAAIAAFCTGCAAESSNEGSTDSTESSESDIRETDGTPVLAHSGSSAVGFGQWLATGNGTRPQDLPLAESGPGSGPQPEPWKGGPSAQAIADSSRSSRK